ncbi:MAG TPA: large conductance mechanosensitive channel protein MscL [Pirellulales bacterium]|jgi:large conductance mechanosensitive channel|nr:large conductance mechanosensitive channel protein MscL [Pirellulales bacterium]
MGMFKEFKEFAMKGNVVDMAVGIIIGAAFGKIVTSLVSDVMMPPLGKLMNNVNFTDLYLNLDPSKTYNSLEAAKKAGAPVIGYGAFLNEVINFIIVAFCVFLVIKLMNSMHKKPNTPAEPAAPPKQEVLLEEIRDLLRAKQ